MTRTTALAIGGDVPNARLYAPAGAATHALVWVHGGAFAWGDLDMPEADWVARWFAERGYEVLSVDYRLAPEPDLAARQIGPGGHPFPAAHRDVVAAFDWMVEHARGLGIKDVVLGGASAGGNLSAGAAVALRDRAASGTAGTTGTAATPAALFLAYPLVHAVMPTPSPEAEAAMDGVDPERRFPPESIRLINLNYVAGDESLLTDPRAFAGEGDVAGLPPTIIVNSESDDLRPSGERFAAQLADAGVEVACSFEPGTFHGHLNEPDLPHAGRTLSTVHHWLSRVPAR